MHLEVKIAQFHGDTFTFDQIILKLWLELCLFVSLLNDNIKLENSFFRTVSPPPSSYRNVNDSSLDEQALISSRSRNDGGLIPRASSVRNRREHSSRTNEQIAPRSPHGNRSLIEKVDFPQAWNEAPRMENSISLDNLHLHLKTDPETMKNLCYRITVTEERVQRGESRRYDPGPSSTAV